MVRVAEKILDWRLRGENVEFYVKWKGQPDAENTWEPESDLDCKDLIELFKKGRRAKRRMVASNTGSPGSSTQGPPGDNATEDEQPSGSSGFDRGLEAEKIIGRMIIGGRIFFLIKFKNEEYGEVVSSTVARRKIPQMVKEFYESRLDNGNPA